MQTLYFLILWVISSYLGLNPSRLSTKDFLWGGGNLKLEITWKPLANLMTNRFLMYVSLGIQVVFT